MIRERKKDQMSILGNRKAKISCYSYDLDSSDS